MSVNTKPISEVVEVNPRMPSDIACDLKRAVDFIPMAQLSEQGYVIPNGSRQLGEVIKGYTYFENGDVLVAKITPCMENGKAAYVNNLPHQIGFGSTEFHVLRPRDCVYGRYLFYMIWNSKFRDEAEGNMTGSAGQKRVPKSFFDRFEIPLPPLSEQKRIADILDKADSIRCKRQEAVRIVKDELFGTIFREYLGDPRTNPKRWPIEQLGNVINFIGGSQPPKETFINEPRPGYVRLVQIRDFKTDKYPTYIPKELAKRRFTKEDVMIARYGPPVFQILRGLEGSYNVALMKAENTRRTTKDFIFYLLQIPEIHDVVVANSQRTAGQSGTNLMLLKSLEVPIPPIEKQLESVAVLKSIETYHDAATRYVKEADALFNSLIQLAFNGKL